MPRPDDRLPRMTFARDRITQYEITTTAGQEPRITLEHDNGRSYSGILVDINDDEITIVRDVRLDIGEIENPTPIGRVTLNNQVMGVARDVRLDIGEIGEPEPEQLYRYGRATIDGHGTATWGTGNEDRRSVFHNRDKYKIYYCEFDNREGKYGAIKVTRLVNLLTFLNEIKEHKNKGNKITGIYENDISINDNEKRKLFELIG